MERLRFYDEISKNKRNSFFLIVGVLLVLMALVYVIALAVGGDYFWVILILGTLISVIYVGAGYWGAEKLALASVGAKPALRERFPLYHNVVEALCLASGLPKPKLYVMESRQINAFASGRNPEHAVICVTTGALEKLNKQELEGVLAHELSHIANYDIRFMTLTAVLVGMVAIISQIFLRSLWYSSFDSRDREGGNSLWVILGIVLAILAPVITMLVQLAISRQREYAADASAVKFVRSPTGLINALKKIKQDNEPIKVSGAVSPLFISNPSRTKELFMTHPPLDKRIKRLERM